MALCTGQGEAGQAHIVTRWTTTWSCRQRGAQLSGRTATQCKPAETIVPEISSKGSRIKIECDPLPDEEPPPRRRRERIIDRASLRERDGFAYFAVGRVAHEERLVPEVDRPAINLCVISGGAHC
eukprot:7389208-Prymnesium_polylepis.1